MSLETFFIAWCIIFSNCFEYSFVPSSTKISCMFQTLSRNLLHPRMLSTDHGAVWSNGPMNISYTRNVSAPYSFITSSGFTTFPLDLLIFSPLDPKIIPWEVRFAYGSFVGTIPISYKNLCQNLEYNKCRVVCSIPPLYQSTGDQYSNASLEAKALSLCGSMYLKKYQDEPAHCGIVSVSLVAGPPQCGQVVCVHSVCLASGDSPFSPGS